MHCGLISDLHLEEYIRLINKYRGQVKKDPDVFKYLFNIPPPTKKLDVLFLAGDICEYRHLTPWEEILAVVSDYADKIVVIPGNHEYYRTSIDKGASYRRLLSSDKVIFLEDEELVVKGVHIYGGTLWTDFADDLTLARMVSMPSSGTYCDNNYKYILRGAAGLPKRKVRYGDVFKIARNTKKSIQSWLERTYGQKRLLLTHYPPLKQSAEHLLSDHPAFYGVEDEFWKIECVNLERDFCGHEDVVLCHGHIHGKGSYQSRVGNLVYSNPRGASIAECECYEILEFEV
ncbi:metallophosphoesterase family protein [Vibrio barjaei]|uniref:metallophosphoesterase family protein n=1 Tax=Vibrio barjaei TaxID=1676683 RepID=UPI0022852ED2|nr:metallophosphoesterase [Vibrio barjaei]MCY9870484.1 metallophosphoesterase [Vibrio barjaei]